MNFPKCFRANQVITALFKIFSSLAACFFLVAQSCKPQTTSALGEPLENFDYQKFSGLLQFTNY